MRQKEAKDEKKDAEQDAEDSGVPDAAGAPATVTLAENGSEVH